jgi:hypothetical protein
MFGFIRNASFTVDYLQGSSGQSYASVSVKLTTYSLHTTLKDGVDAMDCSNQVG